MIRQSGHWLALGRLIAPLATLVVLGVVIRVSTTRGTVSRVYGAAIIPVFTLLFALAVTPGVSIEKVGEATRLALVFVGALLLVFPPLSVVRSDILR